MPKISSLAELSAQSESARQGEIVEVLGEAFGAMIAADPEAFRRKFRKMAADPFAFYRGTACLFYADVVRFDDPWADERTSRVWIQGDLHCENFGTYLNAAGTLIFDVNDFDESYLGHFSWDLRRLAASLALVGFRKAFSDDTITEMIGVVAQSYLERVRELIGTETGGAQPERTYALTLATADGVVLDALHEAREKTRVELLNRNTIIDNHERVFRQGSGFRALPADERSSVLTAFREYLETIPADRRANADEHVVKDVVGRSGFGIGSAGLPAYNLLIEGHTQALENDVVLSMKQGNVAAPSRVVTDESIHAYFQHHGHRTAVSQRALQANSDRWLGWTALRGQGQIVQELSPYESDIDWSNLSEPDEIRPVLTHLGHAVAKVHCVSDHDSDQTLVPFQTEEAIAAVIGDRDADFVADMTDFGLRYAALTRRDHRLFVDAFRNGHIAGIDPS